MASDPLSKLQYVDVNSKLDRLLNASRDKITRLEQQRIAAAEALQADQQMAAQNEKSWVGQLGLEEGSFVANRVNDVASLVSGASRLAGHIVSLPANAIAAAESIGTDEEDVAAWNRVQAGTGTAEDVKRSKTLAGVNYVRGQAREVNDWFKLDSIVNQSNRNELHQDLGEDFEKNWAQVQSGWKDGKPSDLVVGVAKLIGNAAGAAVSNPAAAREYILENVPQLFVGAAGAVGKAGMIASNIGYAADNYSTGLENYAKANHGALPPEAERTRMALLAASLALAESAGDHVGLAAAKLAGRTGDAVADAAATGFKRSVGNTAKAAGQAGLTEAGTEGYQTWAEGEVTGKEASAEDIYVGATIGGIAGAGMSGGARGAAEVFKATPEHQQERVVEAVKTEAFKEAAKAGDPSAFLDDSKPTYDPTKAVGVLFENSQLEDATPEVKQANLEKATQIIEDLESKKDQLTKSVAAGVEEVKLDLQFEIDYLKEQVAAADPADTTKIDNLNGLIADRETRLADVKVDPQEEAKAAKQLKVINDHLGAARQARDNIAGLVDTVAEDEVPALVADIESTNPEKATPAAERIINLSMTAPEKVGVKTAKRLAENMQNGLSDEHREALRQFSEARVAENKLKDMGKVSREIALGSPDMIGIAQYRQWIGTAVKAGNAKAANRQIKLLEKFANDHAEKAAVVAEAFATGRSAQVVKKARGGWEILPRTDRRSDKWMAQNGGVTVHPSSPKSIALGEQIKVEADALAKAHAQLSGAINLKFSGKAGKGAVQSVPSAAPLPPAQSISSSKMEEGKSRLQDELVENGKSNPPLSTQGTQAQAANQPAKTTQFTSENGPAKVSPAASPSSQPSVPVAAAAAPDTAASSAPAGSKQTTTVPPAGATAKAPVAKVEAAQDTKKRTFNKAGDQDIADTQEAVKPVVGFASAKFRGNTEAESDVLEEALVKVRAVMGEEAERAKFMVMAGRDAKGTSFTDTDVVAINERVFTSDRGLQLVEHVIAHELAHLRDKANGWISEQSSALLPGGTVYKEAQASMAKSDILKDAFGYIFNYPQSSRKVPRELYAQLHALYVTHPELFNDNQPLTQAGAAFKAAQESQLAEDQSVPDAEGSAVAGEESTDAGQGTEAARQPGVVEPGTLALFEQREPKDSKVPYLERNLIAEHLVQPAKNEKGTDRPLASVKNFLTQLKAGAVKVEQFLAEGTKLTDAQKDVINDFGAKAIAWRKHIEASLSPAEEKDRKFLFNDLMQYFYTADGKLEENVMTAMAQAGYLAVAEMANGRAFNGKEQINAILGLDKDAAVDPQAKALLENAGNLEAMTRNSMGQAFIAALGLKAKKTTPANIVPQLEAAAGAYVVEMLIKAGLIERHEIPRAAFNEFADYSKIRPEALATGDTQSEVTGFMGTELKGNVPFLRPIRLEDGGVTQEASDIGFFVKESKSILDKLFGTESRNREPLLGEGAEYSQTKAANSKMDVPSELKKALGVQQKQGYKVNTDQLGLVEKMDRQEVLYMMGWKDIELLQKSKRNGQKAKNESLEREYDRFHGFVNGTLKPAGLNTPMFFEHDAWKNQRVGMKTNEINPQTSKYHRQMMYKDGMESVIDLNNVEQMNNLRLRVSEGLGVKVDKQANTKSLEDFKEAIAKPEIEAALAALNSHLHGNKLSAEEQAAITAGVAKAGEGMHSLSALTAWAQYQFAKEQGEKTVTVQLMGEVDGVTNGPMLTHLLMGAAKDVKSLFSLLNRGGFFEVGSPHDQYNVWRGIAKHLDLYENTTKAVVTELQELMAVFNDQEKLWLSAVEVFTGTLYDAKTDTITKDGRNVIKTPLTALVFGSSVDRSIESMAESFVENIYERIQQLNDGKKGAPERSTIIKALRDLNIDITEDTTIEELMEIEFTKRDFDNLKRKFHRTLGVATHEAIKNNFESFISTRNVFNKTAAMAYNLYKSTSDAIRREYTKELIAEGLIPVTGTGEPIHDLNEIQEAELDARLKKALPVLHTAMSSMNDELDAGLMMAKGGERKLNESVPYKNQVRLNRQGGKTVTTYGYSRYMSGPGVAMFSASTHSSDSAIAHKAVRLVNALNVHDALGTGVNSIIDAGKAMNKSTWEVMLDYSPATEVMNALFRTMKGVVDLIKTDPAGKIIAGSIAEDLVLEANRVSELTNGKVDLDPAKMVGDQVQAAKLMANDADTVRLGFLSELKVVSQYAIEGGSYFVKDEERAEAKRRLDNYKYQQTPEQLALVKEFNALVNPEMGKMFEDAKKEDYEPLPEARAELPVLKISTAQAKQLLYTGKSDASPLRPELKAQMSLVYGGMTRRGMDLETAIVSQLPARHAGNMVALLNEMYTKQDVNHWGEVGAPTIDSDQAVLDLFSAHPEITGATAVTRLKKLIRESGTGADAQRKLVLLEEIGKKISPNLKVRLVQPTTPMEDVLRKANGSRSRGWYTAKGSAEGIYLLSPEFKHSGVTVELLMHELTHAALVHATREAQEGTDADAKQLVDNLEEIRAAALAYAEANFEDDKWADALTDIDEMLAWGLNNSEFQAEVLTKIKVKGSTSNNKWISGMKKFLDTITGFFFKNAAARRKEIAQDGFGALLANASGLFALAGQTTSRYDANQSMNNPVDEIAGLSTIELFRSLDNHNGAKIDTEFNEHLEGLLSKIVEKVHGPYGTFKAELMKSQDLSGREILAQAMTSGEAPFASEAQSIGMTEQEAYVLEQVEATVATALNDGAAQTSMVHRELTKLYNEMSGKLKPEHFYEGEWVDATAEEKAEAQALHDMVFKVEAGAGDRSDYLARFAALGLANKEVRNAMQIATSMTSNKPAPTDFLTRLMAVFESVLGWIGGRMTNTFPGQQADAKLGSLVQQLVDIEVKRRNTMIKRAAAVNPAEDMMANASQAVRKKVAAFGQSSFFQDNKNSFVKLAGSVTTMVASDRLGVFTKGLQQFRDENFQGKQGMFAGIINEMRGGNASNIVFHFLLRAAKKIEGQRKDIMTGTQKLLLGGFLDNGENLDQSDKAALTGGALRTGMADLLDHYSVNEINTLVQNDAALDRAIRNFESQLAGSKYRHFYIKQAKLLGYHMTTGDVRADLVLFNAGNIARLYETPYASRITEEEAATNEAIIDPLVSLYALKYTRTSYKLRLRKIFKQEMARPEGNGMELLLKMHKHLLEESKARLFDDAKPLFMKGYTPEIYNPYKSVVVATLEEGASLEEQGWVKGDPVFPDENDPNQETKHLYSLRDGGMARRVSGTMSNTGMKAKGSQMHNGNISPVSSVGSYNLDQMNELSASKRSAIVDMFKADPDFDPTEVNKGKQFMVPVLNAKGKAANYRYMMKHTTKDRVLERDNRFEHILGTMAGSIYDKQQTKQQNRKVVEALHAQYKAEYGEKAKSYVRVGPLSQDPEMREIYNVLPDATKQAIREVWGKDEMMVRVDLLDINFGYRKLSWADAWGKDATERGLVDEMLITAAEYVFGKKAPLKLRQGEQVWQTLVHMTKDNMVVKSFSTLAGNFKSNITELLWFGVPAMDIIKHHRVALKGALDYRKDSAELFDLEHKLGLEYMVSDRAAMERRAIQLRDAIARNPVKPLIDAGLMPTIVEDVDMEDDIYSYKSKFVRSTEKVTKHLNKHVVTAGKWVLITQDTPLYKVMSHGTQLSDFVARYTLYQHLTTRSKERMEHLDAVQLTSEAFVNYDIPAHRKLQALNDNGIVWFTKYYLRIQKVIMMLMRDNPGRAMAMVGLENYFSTLPTLLDSSMAAKIDNNPFSTGALKLASTHDDLMTVKLIMSPFKGE